MTFIKYLKEEEKNYFLREKAQFYDENCLPFLLFFSSVITNITKLYELLLIPGYSGEMRNDDSLGREMREIDGHAYGSRVVKTIIKYCCKCCRENFFTHLP